MTKASFFVPRGVVAQILQSPRSFNPTVCVKLHYRGYEISLALDSSHGLGDLFRGDFRVWRLSPGTTFHSIEFTEEIAASQGSSMLYGDLDTLLFIKKWIDDNAIESTVPA